MRRYIGVVGYGILVAVIMATSWRVQQINGEVDRVVTYQVDLLCEEMNETREMTLEILETTDPDVVERFRPILEQRDCPPDRP